jgi:hypothetical protein
MTTDLATRPENGEVAMLFAGATPAELITAATAAADQLAAVVKQQELFQQIRDRKHVLIEGWQTVGAMVGVFAVKDSGVAQLAWPALEALGEEPPAPGREPRRASADYPEWERRNADYEAWERLKRLHEARAAGLAYGFSTSWNAVRGETNVGWGEGRCTRAESNWATSDDYALASMAQTRGQSRALAAPLRWIVKLAGYSTTPAEEVGDERAAELEAQLQRAEEALVAERQRATADVRALDEEGLREVAAALQARWPQYDGHGFVRVLGRRLPEGIPEAAGVALRAFAWWVDTPGATGNEGAQEAGEQATAEDSQ